MKLVQDFYHSGVLLDHLNSSLIFLIHKLAYPQSFIEYRPTSLCNFGCKIISKVLARSWLNDLISPLQAAFVPHRIIHDNILIAHEMFNSLKKRRKGRKGAIVVKADIHKAYDSVKWDFLILVMKRLGFSETWIKWIFSYISTVQYLIVINREHSLSFRPYCGLRQGDPISLYLFLLVSDVIPG